jgi:predicted Fe-Mo cluster-binding NifX family protein
MNQQIVIPVEDASGAEAKIAQHFGKAPYIALVEANAKGQIINVKINKNTGEHMGGAGHPHENVLSLKPTIIIACAMGPGGLNSFKDAGIKVLKAQGNTVNEVMTNYQEGKLEPLTGGCPHAHEHHHEH